MVKAYSEFMSVRNTTSSSDKHKKVYTRGYCAMSNKPDLWQFTRLANGKTRAFKSLFTDKCLRDMEKQFMNSRIFVDGMHETGTNAGVMAIMDKYNVPDEDKEITKKYLQMKKLPISKPVGMRIDDNGIVFEAETNPYFAEVDSEHASYYDALTNSILDGYIKGYSINFDPIEYVTENDNDGNELTKIDKINWYGVSYTDDPALKDNTFTEVCMRSVIHGERTEGRTMANEQTQPTIVNQGLDADAVTRIVEQRVAQALKNEEIKRQEQDQKEQLIRLKEERDRLLKEVEESKKVKQEPNTGSKVATGYDKYGAFKTQGTAQITPDWVNDKLRQIVPQYTDWVNDKKERGKADGMPPMKGFGELIQLQADLRTHQMRESGETDEQYRQRMIWANSDADVVIKARR